MTMDRGLKRDGGGGWKQDMETRTSDMWMVMKNVDRGSRLCVVK